MADSELRKRTKLFALRVIRLVEVLPRSRTCEVVGRQLLRSATSVGANYRAACRAKSSADFIAKMGIVEEEADESIYWMELLLEAGIVGQEKLADLMREGNEITAMVVASIRTARAANSQGSDKSRRHLREHSADYAVDWSLDDLDNMSSND